MPSRDGDLCLLLPEGGRDSLHYAVTYDDLRHDLLDECDALNKIVIRDCCFSGNAITRYMGEPDDFADRVVVESTYVMTARQQGKKSFAARNRNYTAFTGELIATLGEGVPGGLDPLPMDAIFRDVRQRLLAQGMPEPQQRATGGGTPSRWCATERPAPPQAHRSYAAGPGGVRG